MRKHRQERVSKLKIEWRLIIMTKLKAGKLYMYREDVLKGAGLPLDTHLEVIGYDNNDHAIEFKVVTNSDVEHECLVDYHEFMTTCARRFPVKFEYKEDSWTMTDEQLDKHQKLADLLLAYDKMGVSPDVAMDIIKNSVQ